MENHRREDGIGGGGGGAMVDGGGAEKGLRGGETPLAFELAGDILPSDMVDADELVEIDEVLELQLGDCKPKMVGVALGLVIVPAAVVVVEVVGAAAVVALAPGPRGVVVVGIIGSDERATELDMIEAGVASDECSNEWQNERMAPSHSS